MPNDLLKATAGSVDIGVNIYTADLGPELNLDLDSVNLTSGIYRGIGPRVGMQTLPGHAHNEPLASNANNTLRQAEESIAAPNDARCLNLRYSIFNIFSFKLAKYDDINTEITVYAWLMSSQGRNASQIPQINKTNLSLFLNCTYAPSADPVSQQFMYSDDFRDGFHPPQGYGASKIFPLTIGSNFFWWNPINQFVETIGTSSSVTKAQGADTLLTITENTNYVKSINVSYSGRIVPMEFCVGDTAGSTPSATRAPDIGFSKYPGNLSDNYGFRYGGAGVPSSIQKGNYRNSARSFRVYAIGAQDFVNAPSNYVATYDVFVTQANMPNVLKPTFNYPDAAPGAYNADFSGITATLLAGPVGAGSYGSIKSALCQDYFGFTSSAFKAVLSAPGKAVCWVIQDWIRSTDGTLCQVVDLTSHSFGPPLGTNNPTGGDTYRENGIAKATAFNRWPNYIDNTPLAPAYGVSLSPTAGSGIFRANTTYELAYSYYNKRLDYETNVGGPVKFNTDTVDFIALQVTNTTGGTRPGIPRYTQSEGAGILFWEYGNFQAQTMKGILNLEINFTEIRFYYRVFGSFEWLPLYQVDAAKWWFYPEFINPSVPGSGLLFGETPIASLPGGQPGGFVDYSKLPNLDYNCVLTFQDRIWWFASDSVNFSLRNNMFTYPVRNSISCRTGNFEGGMVHNYPGQAQQSSRLLIFGTKEVYVARFSGVLNTSPVQVSSDTIGEYPVDASDLVVDTWTTNTAFSYRSAVVAEGLAYWWGPSGVYRDNGVDTPKKISLKIEPNLNDVYDVADTKNINCSYDETTKEITWFYKPKDATSTETAAITWNIIDESWLLQSFGGVVDNVFPVRIETDLGTAGVRNIMVSRADRTDKVARAYFYDGKTRGCADIYPKRDFVVKEISTPITGRRRLTLAVGYDPTNFATMQIGDLIALKNVRNYAPAIALAEDMLCQILGVNTGSGYIDVKIPVGAQIDASATLTQGTYFPIYHKTQNGVGLNGFEWRFKTTHWLPFGINFFANWLWLYILHKIKLAKNDGTETYELGYRSVTSGDFIYDTVVYKDNSDGHWQLYHPFRVGETNNQGQTLKMDLRGIQIATDLVIQFLEAHCTEQTGNDLKQFEG